MNSRHDERIVYLATNNAHKIEEFQAIAGDVLKIMPISSLGKKISWDETGTTFVENARIKAQALREHTHHAVIADDSGLAVKVLNGAPGVYSSRFGGEEGNDAKNNQRLLSELAQIGDKEFAAEFVCCLVFIDEFGHESVFFGQCEGKIILEKRGSNGFGYDPLFVPDGYDKTLAELPSEVKNLISHRKNAVTKWINFLNKHEG